MKANHNLRGAFLSLMSMGLYSTHDAIVKVLGVTFTPMQIVFFSALISFPLLVVVLLRDQSGGSLRPKNPGWVAVRTLSFVATAVLAFYAFATLPFAQTYAILFATPLLVTVLSIPILGEKVRARRWTAVIVGLVGVMIVLRPTGAPLALGHLAALVSALAGALAVLSVRKVGDSERPVVLLLYPILANIAIMGATLPLVYRPMSGLDLGLMAIIAVLGLGGTLLSILAYRSADAGVVAPMQYSQILWAILYGALFFNEWPDRQTLIGATVVIASGLYILMREALPGRSATRPATDASPRSDLPTQPRPRLIQRLLSGGDE